MDESGEIVDLETEEFYGFIRRHLVCILFFSFLYAFSYIIIKYMKVRPDNDELYAGDEDYFVYRISTWICSNSLSISIGAVTLLPFSVMGAEILQRYPENYYLKWLNFSLINTLWSYVFLLSNFSLFVLLPFSYFFIESQGFSLNLQLQTLSCSIRRPLLARFYETMVVCTLVIVILIGIADIFYSHLFTQPSYIWLSLLCFSSLSTPLLYSFTSLIGVFLLLISLPLGFSKMFDIFTEMLVKQRAGQSSTTNPIGKIPFYAITAVRLQEMTRLRRQNKLQKFNNIVYQSYNAEISNGQANGAIAKISKTKKGPGTSARHRIHQMLNNSFRHYNDKCKYTLNLLLYPVIMLTLFLLTALCILMVTINTLQLLFGFRDLPVYVQYVEEYRHTLGIFGAFMEVTIILYLMVSSLVGLYSIPFVRRIRPRKGRTSITSIIINCLLSSLLTSALPVLVRTLGISTFDLLGEYGRINWISNLTLVLGYNVLFAAVSIYCIVYKFTEPVRKELLQRFYAITRRRRPSGFNNDFLTTAKKED